MLSGADIENRSCRIAIVIGQLSHGGAERQLTLLAQGMLKECEFIPVVFCLSDVIEPYGSMLLASGVQYYFPPSTIRSRVGRLLWLIKSIKSKQCRLVYGIINIGSIYGGAAAKALRLPFIGSIRSADGALPYSIRTLSGYFNNKARLVIANSKSCVTSLHNDLRVTHDRIHIIPNGVSVPEPTSDSRSKLLKEWGIPERAVILGTVAALRVEKRVEFFLRVAHVLFQRFEKPVYFLWIGDGPERTNIANYLEMFPEDFAKRVSFPGARLDVPDCLHAFDAFILTSAYEGLPNALLEAMASGLPCVASNVPGSRDIIEAGGDNVIGLLADAENPEVFAKEMMKLIRAPDRMRELGQQSHKFVQNNYSLENMTREFCNVFRSVIDVTNHC